MMKLACFDSLHTPKSPKGDFFTARTKSPLGDVGV
jgi:hypothetical protein